MIGMFRRRLGHYIINQKFQVHLISRFVLLACLNFLLLFASIKFSYREFNKYMVDAGVPPGSAFFEVLQKQQNFLNFAFLIAGVVMALTLIVVGIVLSHRVAGPLYRLNQHMADVASGKTTDDVVFRKRDYFPEIAAGFNSVMKRFRTRKSA